MSQRRSPIGNRKNPEMAQSEPKSRSQAEDDSIRSDPLTEAGAAAAAIIARVPKTVKRMAALRTIVSLLVHP
jgi:hypothetical protein